MARPPQWFQPGVWGSISTMSPSTASARPPEEDWLGTPHLRFERHGPLAICVVDRPERRNALTPAMYFGIRRAVDLVNRDARLTGLLITGTGDVFISGGDLSLDGYDDDWADLADLLAMDNVPFEAIRNSRKPTVCAVNGMAEGGGLMIALLSDVTVASERAIFRAPELFRGIADMNYANVLPKQIGFARARDMLFTGRRVTAAEALDWGMISRVVPHSDLAAHSLQVLRECSYGAPHARFDVKRAINAQYGSYDRMTMDLSLHYGGESDEGFRAFAERRAPNWIPDEIRPDGRL
jgi:enoyl-CoA hydratase